MKTQNKTLIIYTVATLVLAVPLVAMQFTSEVTWSVSDFTIAGILLFATAFTIDSVLRKIKSDSKRFIYIALALIVLLLVWAELAVGIFGSRFAGT